MLKSIRLKWYKSQITSNDPEKRREAAEALGELDSEKAIELLTMALSDANGDVRNAAATALGKAGGSKAANIMAKLGDPKTIDLLINGLENWDWTGRKAAAKALGVIGGNKVIWPLMTALVDSSEGVRSTAAASLAKLGHPKWKQWIQGDMDDYSRLGSSGDDRAYELLIHAMRKLSLSRLSQGFTVYSFKTAIEMLSKISDPRATEAFVHALKAPALDVRTAAAKALVKVAQTNPEQFIGPWRENIPKLIKTPHEDQHADNIQAPDLHADAHTDVGIGMEFPDFPDEGDVQQKDQVPEDKIRVVCPDCHENLLVPKEAAGQEGACPVCGKLIPIPKPDQPQKKKVFKKQVFYQKSKT